MPTQEKLKGGRRVYTMRLGVPERAVIAAAAAQRREPVSAFIRRTALAAARRELAPQGSE